MASRLRYQGSSSQSYNSPAFTPIRRIFRGAYSRQLIGPDMALRIFHFGDHVLHLHKLRILTGSGHRRTSHNLHRTSRLWWHNYSPDLAHF